MIINGDALSTTSRSVSLTLSGIDQTSGVSKMSFSNDGTEWSLWQTYSSSAAWTILPGNGGKTVFLRLQDLVGHVSLPFTDTIELDTTVGNEYSVLINDGAPFTNQVTVTLSLGAPAYTTQMKLSDNGGFPGAEWEPYCTHKSWIITQLGSYLIPRIVYSKYKDLDGNISATYQDDIILDVIPPTGSVSILGVTSLRPAQAATVTLLLSAIDDVSGVGGMQISSSEEFSGAEWEPYATTHAWDMEGGEFVYVRYRDNAGNVSVVYQAIASHYLFLPMIVR